MRTTTQPLPYDPNTIPLYETKPIFDETGAPIVGFSRVVEKNIPNAPALSVVSADYELVQHRSVAAIAHRVLSRLDKPDDDVLSLRNGTDSRFANGRHFHTETVSLYSKGRHLEYRAIVGRKFRLDGGNEFYPGIRVDNGLDGKVAVRVSGFAVRLACTNQLYATQGNVVNLREVHLQNEDEILGQVEKAVYDILDHFPAALDAYAAAQSETIHAVDVFPALVERGLPAVHAAVIGKGAVDLTDEEPSGPLVRRWDAYQVATDYLTHAVHVAPDRARSFERQAAAALLLKNGEADKVAAKLEPRQVA